ncbi:hypothetical protein BU23DRAFT_577939 [Bimuria novae-zelandiae CBS 107.79]|uniref:Rhodopsin domain-containing protein n=1 Tax=Bimuria novae-zelandiae CBS 107.79 TaxID=1447943 RepID=A0A6A5VK87_9PLEO|nr:hypothetical protein BU23DRAFT_577939 [Bimuria novae-zelandiae CBS 107.79]
MTLEENPRGRQAVILSGVFSAFATSVVFLRLYTRFFVVRCPGVEDYCISAALLCAIGLNICIGIQAQHGMGRHIWDIFGCRPIQAFWTLKHPFKCLNQYAVWFFNGGMNILTDLTISVLPMPVIRKLNLPRRQKQALVGIFAVGGFVCLVSILRLQSLVAISNSSDPTYDNPPAATWSSVETNIGIICSSLPCLRPLITRYLPGVLTASSTSTRSWRCNGDKAAPRASRSIFGRYMGASTKVKTLKSEEIFDPNQVKEIDSIIRVATEVHVTSEEKRKSEMEGKEEV